MRSVLIALGTLLISITATAQQKFYGTWEGKINAGVSLRVVFIFSANGNNGLKAVLKSPDQSPASLPADTTYAIYDSIHTSLKKFGIAFHGKLMSDSSIEGSFIQGIAIPVSLKKVDKISTVSRPQTPKPPFPYNSEEIVYYNSDRSLSFGGTLTWPAIPAGTNYIKAPVYPTVLLISGSGPQDRDETILQHKPFAVIADYLTRQGFAVLRVDDRGVGKSTGRFAGATSADFADDASAGIDYLKTLKQVDTTKIGLIGHSEGGMIAPMIAACRNDVAFIVLLAGPGIPVRDLMAKQITAVAASQGASALASELNGEAYRRVVGIVQRNTDTAVMKKQAEAMIAEMAHANESIFAEQGLGDTVARKHMVDAQVDAFMQPWFRYFLSVDPAAYLQKLHCNVLALNGSADIQVVSQPNLAGIQEALKRSRVKKYMVKELPGLNHLFQACKRCTADEYGELEESFSPVALKLMGDWLNEQK